MEFGSFLSSSNLKKSLSKLDPPDKIFSGSAHVQTTPGFHQGMKYFFADQIFVLELDLACTHELFCLVSFLEDH